MRALILAAGEGRRLGPSNARQPKCLIEISGKTLLAYSLDALAAAGVQEVFLVHGHEGGQIIDHVHRLAPRPGMAFHFVNNPRYATGGSLSSFLAGLAAMPEGDLMVLEADILYHPDYARALVAAGGNTMLVCNPSGSGDEVYAVVDPQRRIRELSKDRALGSHPQCVGEMSGMTRLSCATAQRFTTHLRQTEPHEPIGDYEISLLRFCAAHPDRDGMQALSMGALPWTEVDNQADLERARTQVYPRLRGLLSPPG